MIKVTPLLFTEKNVRRYVAEDRPGVYVLGNDVNGFKPCYVGRSDRSIRRRLLTHNHLYDFEYFIFKYTKDEKEAFYGECKWWHDCNNQGAILANKIHPDSPSDNNLECPYCSFNRSVIQSL